MSKKRKLLLGWIFSLVLAVIIGRYLGRAIAWYVVYSQPSNSRVIKMHPDGRDQEKRGQQSKRLTI